MVLTVLRIPLMMLGQLLAAIGRCKSHESCSKQCKFTGSTMDELQSTLHQLILVSDNYEAKYFIVSSCLDRIKKECNKLTGGLLTAYNILSHLRQSDNNPQE